MMMMMIDDNDAVLVPWPREPAWCHSAQLAHMLAHFELYQLGSQLCNRTAVVSAGCGHDTLEAKLHSGAAFGRRQQGS